MRWLGALWLLPAALPVWLLFILPAWAVGWIRLWTFHDRRIALEFHVAPGTWFDGLWTWSLASGSLMVFKGLALPFAILLHPANVFKLGQTMRDARQHELAHIDQWLILGPLMPIALGTLYLCFGYFDSPLEVVARAMELLP